MAAGTITSRQIVEQYLARIDAYDQRGPAINAFISLNPKALDEAAAFDAERKAGRTRGPLHGIPVAIKDNYITADLPTTGGSLALQGFAAGRDAFMVRKLRQAGAVVIGKTNLHELAYGITSVSSMGGQTRNPYDPARNPGGSSGGTGAAVAASFAAAGMGTDTCGSIRIPSAHNNLFGLRGTRGLSSRDGIIPLSMTQDIGGPLARSVADLILMLDATVGFDPADPVTSASDGKIPRTYMGSVGDSSLGNVHVAILTPYFGAAPEDEEVGAIVRKAVGELENMGARVSEVAPEGFDALLLGTSLINAEFKFDLLDFLAKFRGPVPVRSLARRPDERPVSQRDRRRPAPRRRSRVARHRDISHRACEARGRDASDQRSPRPARHHRARLPDDPPQGRAGRRGAAGIQLPAQCDDRAAGDRDAGRLHRRMGFPSASNCWARPSASRRFSESPSPTSESCSRGGRRRQYAATEIRTWNFRI